MRRSRTVGRSARPAWVTRAEAAFLARVPVEEIDRWAASGRLATRRVGANVFVDLAALEPAPATPPSEARSVRGARGRSDRALPAPAPKRRRGGRPGHGVGAPGAAAIVGTAAAVTAVGLFVLQIALFGGSHRGAPTDLAFPSAAPATSAPPAMPVGRDPFASPFGAPGTGDKDGGVLVKPPGVVREGDAVTAATTVVNQNPDRWLPTSEITFVARDDTGHVIARATTTVSIGPGRTKTVVAPPLSVDPAAIAAIEAHIDPAPLRTAGYRAPSVRVARAAVTDDGRAIQGLLDVARGAAAGARLSCVLFDPLDQLAAVSTTNVDLSRARSGRLRFWLTAQPATPGPYRASCSVS